MYKISYNSQDSFHDFFICWLILQRVFPSIPQNPCVLHFHPKFSQLRTFFKMQSVVPLCSSYGRRGEGNPWVRFPQPPSHCNDLELPAFENDAVDSLRDVLHEVPVSARRAHRAHCVWEEESYVIIMINMIIILIIIIIITIIMIIIIIIIHCVREEKSSQLKSIT